MGLGIDKVEFENLVYMYCKCWFSSQFKLNNKNLMGEKN